MPRGPRRHFPGAVLHVYGRGNEKRQIFLDDKDRHVFLDRLVANLARWNMRCLAWALMPNHFHLLLKSESGELPSFMRCLLTGFSIYFNERHKRVGHLFQNRYMSRVISKESYLREVTRYIHLNPLRAGLVGSLAELDNYPWTGHLQMLSACDAGWMDFDLLQEIFPDTAGSKWKMRYRHFMEEGCRAIGLGKTDERGEPSQFTDQAESPIDGSANESRPPDKFFEILARISAQTGIPAGEIVGRGKKYVEVRARRDVLSSCVSEMNVPAAKVCRWLGITEGSGGYLLRTKNSIKGSS